MIGVKYIAHEIPVTNDTTIIRELSLRFDAVPMKAPIIAADIIPIESLIDSNLIPNYLYYSNVFSVLNILQFKYIQN